ncbi:uncharacterized protein LOC136075533 isoform X1 [Hydra vulgaris]|uniref:Uncharacterized protein LOC136075533 isoform X1 n=1 Tax=Hydra vulgaris TaxID=6087 RepID=A0ABM4B839_HYDVU
MLYYICCNHFSLYECHMNEFVGSIEKTSNVTVVCDNLYNLWKSMFQEENISNISLPKLLMHLASINSNKVCFVLEELSEEYVKEDEATQIKDLFTFILNDSLVVFIPESITKNRELVTNKQKHTLQRNFFQEEIIGMKVIFLNKSMRVTECNKLLIDIAQNTIYETKSVLNIPKPNLRTLLENKKSSFEGEDLQMKSSKINSMKNNVKDNEKINVTNETVDKYSDSISDQSSENKYIDTNVNDFYDIDKDSIYYNLTSTINIDPYIFMETQYEFKSSVIGHSIKGEKPKVVYLPFYDITDIKSVKILSIMLEKLCFNVLRKTVVICNNIEEVQCAAYAIKNIKRFKAVTYSPHLRKYTPLLKEKNQIKEKLRYNTNILVTDCKGFSGAESQSVIVFVSPEEIYLRHVLVDAISRSNSHLTVLVKNCKDNKELLNKDKTIGNVLTNWSEEKVVEKVIIASSSNTKNRESTDVFFVINENCKAFKGCGSTQDLEKYKERSQFQIFHENNSIYEDMVSNLSNQVKPEFKQESFNSSEFSNIFLGKKEFVSPKMDGYDLMISYSHVTREVTWKIHDWFEKHGFKIWIDKNYLDTELAKEIQIGIDKSSVFIPCFSSHYEKSLWCHKELIYASNNHKPIIPIIVENGYVLSNEFKFKIAGLKYFTLEGDFDTAMNQVLKAVKRYTNKTDF